MKFAIVSAVKAFISQVKENTFELAKKTCEQQGYEVKPKKENK